MERLLAIDPGSNKCGVARFTDGWLTLTETLVSTKKTPVERRLDIAEQLEKWVGNVDVVVCEEPFLQGQNNNGMQRLLGTIEFLAQKYYVPIHFIHPMSVKKAMGRGSLDKEEVKTAANKLLTDADIQMFGTNLYEELFLSQRYDETDAIAIGLTYQIREGERSAPETRIEQKSNKSKHRRARKKRKTC